VVIQSAKGAVVRSPSKAVGRVRKDSRPAILFAWEVGANLGHAFPMAQIAKKFSEDGYRCYFAMRDLAYGRLALEGTGIPLLQAPVWPEHQFAGNQDGQASYADILALIGFGDFEKLAAMLASWNSLLDLVEPRVVVVDHCPALMPLLQARDIASVAVGTGFTMPPLEFPSFPPLRADRGVLLPEQHLLTSLTKALSSLDLPQPNSLVDAFRSTDRVVFSFPELDAYRSWRREPLYLAPEPLPSFREPPIVPHLFVYVGSEFPDTEDLAQVLGQLPFNVSCFLRDAPKALNLFLRMRGLTVFDRPPVLAELLPKISHVLSQGGNFMCHATLAAGRPHLILPIHGESQANLDTLKGMGVARGLTLPFNGQLRERIVDFLTEASMLSKARTWAMLIANREQAPGLQVAIAAIRHCADAK
jgi:hypothetical protein